MRYQSTRPKRQFLAGVKCPVCQKLDVVVQIITFDPPDEYIECTACQHQERRPNADEVKLIQAENAVGIVKFL